MSRKYRYQKNLTNPNPPRNLAPNRRGHAQQFGDNGYSQHDNRFDNTTNRINTRPSRGMRGFKQGGRNLRNDLRNNLRNNHNNNNNNGPHVKPEEETFKITIPHGDKYEQTYLMNLLRENIASEGPGFIFYNFSKVQATAVFFVVGADTADTLRNLSRRIVTHTGQRLVILTTKSPLPSAVLDERTTTTIKAAMSRLYDPNTHVMDLSNFRDADEFKQQGLFIAIGRANVLRTVVSIITENTPNLLAINLRDNKLNYLESLRPLVEKCTSLKAIDLSKNKIHNFDEINNLRGLDLVEVVLEGNPFVDDFPSHASYISSIRKIFKSLKKLDNEDLPSEIGFDLGVSLDLPKTIDHHIPETMKSFVYEFLEAYYKIYDSDSRQGLIQAYHDAATFTYSYARHEHSLYKPNDQMFKESHNLLRLKDESLWVKFVKTTNVDIVSFLCKFPNTQHDPASFHIDVPFFEPTFVIIVVNGLFNETFKANKPLRSFCRTFFIVPQGQGFVIVNDMLKISNPSNKQSMAHTKKNVPLKSVGRAQDRVMNDIEFSQPSTSTAFVPQQQPSTSTATLPPPTLSPQEEITQKFMQVTNMNRDFSLKCLQENNFNAEAAYLVFQKLQTNNMIPAEAFIK